MSKLEEALLRSREKYECMNFEEIENDNLSNFAQEFYKKYGYTKEEE